MARRYRLAELPQRGPYIEPHAPWLGQPYSEVAFDPTGNSWDWPKTAHPPPYPPTTRSPSREEVTTGVFNRRASRSKRGKVNDPVKWVWSPEPTHEPLIPKWMFDEMTARTQAKRGSRAGNDRNTHPETRRTYLFRGMVFCGCGRRMFGGQRHKPSYLCWPRNNNRGRPDRYEGHPKTVYLREDHVLDAVSRFFPGRVFGPHRREILAADVDGIDGRVTRQRQAERDRLQRVLADIARRQNTILRQAQDGDPDDPFTKGLRGSYNELETQKKTTLASVAELDAAGEAEPGRPSPDDTALLDSLPYLALNLAHVPEALLRRLFEVTQLTVRLRDDSDHATITIKLPADQLSDITHAAERIKPSHAIYTRNTCSAGVNRSCRCCKCPRSGSNRHLDDFKSSASANWATGAFRRAYARRTGYDAGAVRSVPRNRRTCFPVGSVTGAPARSSRLTGPRSDLAPSRAQRSRRPRSRLGVRTNASRS